MIVYTVYGMTCMFLYVEREQSVVARGEERDVLWAWTGRLAGWLKGFPAPSQVCPAPLKRERLVSNRTGAPARPPSQPPAPSSGRSSLSREAHGRRRGPQLEKAREVRYFNTERSYMSGSFDILNSCCCPVWSTVYVPPPLSPSSSIILHLALLYIHTRTYWNAWWKHLIAFCGLCLFFFRLHCFCLYEGGVPVSLILI